jgi:hypothetical protein
LSASKITQCHRRGPLTRTAGPPSRLPRGRRKTFERVSPRKAVGPDCIHSNVLRACADQLAGVFKDIFNRSLSQSAVPIYFKMAAIVPVPKNAKLTELNGHRPVALIWSKHTDRVVKKAQQCLFYSGGWRNVTCHLKPSQTFTDAQLRASCRAVSPLGTETAPPSTARLSRGWCGLLKPTLDANYLPSRTPTAPRCHRKAKKIIKDINHLSHCLFTTIQKARSVQVHQSRDRETEKQLLSQGHQTAKQLLSQGHQTVKQLLSQGHQTVKQLLSQGHQTVKQLLSQGHQTGQQLLSQGHQTVKQPSLTQRDCCPINTDLISLATLINGSLF